MGAMLTVKGKDLPPDWAAKAKADPEETYVVYIEPEDSELARASSLAEMARIIGQRAAERGLTEEKLNEILNEK